VRRKQRIGFVGVGLMGHGIAKNLCRGGFPLAFLEHPGNQPADDLRELGAASSPSPRALAQEADVVCLCVTGSPQVEDVMLRGGGVLEGIAPGKLVIDCSTVAPATTLRVAAAVAERGGRFLDAPLTRTPKEAEAGRLNVMVGGEAETLAEARPLFDAFAENVYHAGPVGAGARLKLLHNFVSLGNSVLLAEAMASARRGEVDMRTFVEVLASGGGDSVALKRLAPYAVDGDDAAFRFSLANAAKDMRYYVAMADELGVPSFGAHAVEQVYALAEAMGRGASPVPRLLDILAALDGSAPKGSRP